MEFHPILWVLGDDDATVIYPYFDREPWIETGRPDYADPTAVLDGDAGMTYDFQHTLGDVVSAVTGRGLVVEYLHEFEECSFQRVKMMVRGEDRQWRFPPGTPSLPCMYSLLATKLG